MLDDWNKTNKLAVSIDLDYEIEEYTKFLINIFTFILFLFFFINYYMIAFKKKNFGFTEKGHGRWRICYWGKFEYSPLLLCKVYYTLIQT